MKSLGSIIKDTRLKKEMSLEMLEDATKIKKQFLSAIETQKWESLPDYPVLQGFVRLIGHALDIDENKLIAFLRRDYPPKQLRVSPKPDLVEKWKWTPRLTFVFGALFVFLILAGYLVYQYINFVRPPRLIITAPEENAKVIDNFIVVSGETADDAVVRVNNQPFVVDANGHFSGEIEVSKDTSEIEVKATSRTGKETLIRRRIETDF